MEQKEKKKKKRAKAHIRHTHGKGFGRARIKAHQGICASDNSFRAAAEGDKITLKDGREGILLLYWHRAYTSFLFSHKDEVVLISSILEIAKVEQGDANQWLEYERIITTDI